MSQVMQHVHAIQPMMTLTSSAQARITKCLGELGHQGLRLSVKKTGCSGLSYVMDYVAKPQESDLVMNLTSDYVLCVDKSSYIYLKGLCIDYVKQGIEHKFVFNNPNPTGACGCGESFTVSDEF